MTRVLFIVIAVLQFLVCEVLYPQDVEEIVAKLQKKYESVRDLSASFTQNVRFGVTQSTQSFEGRLWLKKNNKYRIEMDQQTIVTDGNSVWTYSSITGQVFIDNFRDDPKAMTPERFLATAPKDFQASMLSKERLDGKEVVVVKFIPRERKSTIQSMKIWVTTSDWLMVKVEVLDAGETVTTYSVKELRLNSGISDTLFQFVPPPEAEVIDLRTSP
jgi:outer membrane lipoprotein carrier protein